MNDIKIAPVILKNLKYPTNIPDEIVLSRDDLKSYRNIIPYLHDKVVRQSVYDDTNDIVGVALPDFATVIKVYDPLSYGIRFIIDPPTEGKSRRTTVKIRLNTILGIERYEMDLWVEDGSIASEMLFIPYKKVDGMFRAVPFTCPQSFIRRKPKLPDSSGNYVLEVKT